MIATLPYIRQKFDEYNQQIFDGQLPEIPIALTSAKTFIGKCTFRRKRTLLGKEKCYDFRMRFSTRVDLSEKELEDTIIHEMIHYYIGYKDIKDSSAHGPVFRKLMTAINQRYNRNISISHRRGDEGATVLPDKRLRYRLVAKVFFKDGRIGIKVLPKVKQSIATYCKAVMSNAEIAGISLYWSKNPNFSAFPCSGAFKVHFIPTKELDEYFEGAVKVEVKTLLG